MTLTGLLPSTGVILAPMAGGPTSTALILAVARAGGLPFVAGGNRTAEDLAAQIAEVRAGTPVFGVNLFVPSRFDPSSMPVDEVALAAYLDRLRPVAQRLGAEVAAPQAHDDHWVTKTALLLRDPVPIVSFTFGCPPAEFVRELHAVGSAVVVGVTTPDEARVATLVGADGLVVQSGQAGGHSTSWHPARFDATTTTAALVRAIATAVDNAVRTVDAATTAAPTLIAAGGITTRATAEAAIAAGAAAVQLGTAFLLADEAGTRAPHRAALLERTRPTVMSRAFTGRPARMLVNEFTERFDSVAPLAYPHVQSATADIRRASLEANSVEHTTAYAGTGYTHARPGSAAEIVARIAPFASE